MITAALDFGRRRIGVAITEPSGRSVLPVACIQRTTLLHDLATLGELLSSRHVQRVVVGLPLNMDGTEGESARMARAFAKSLAQSVAMAVELFDERLTSFEARQRLSGLPRRRARQRKQVDAVAAMVILESWLDGRPPTPGAA